VGATASDLCDFNSQSDMLPPWLRTRHVEEQLVQTKGAVICALNQLLDLKDLGTGVHSTRLAELALQVATQVGVTEKEYQDIEAAAILHDIGKIGVPDEILNKPGPLTSAETLQMQRHSEHGWAILRAIPGFERTSLLVLHHHERIDGTGYPARLKGDEIPMGARIVCVVDAFDAMVSNRSYRAGLSVVEALSRIQAASGTQFEPIVVDHFTRLDVNSLPKS
jgi:HD-GYP domain-containing protein (c-di-GMP phosphodiesterase class II)